MKEFWFIASARIMVVLLQLLGLKIYTNYLNAGQLGIFYFLLSISYFANALIFVPIDYYQQAKLLKIVGISGGIRPILNFNISISIYFSILTLVIVILTALLQPEYISRCLILIIMAFTLYIVQALRNALNNLEHKKYVSISYIHESFLKILVFCFFITNGNVDEFYLILSWIISLIVTAIYLIHIAYKLNLFKSSEEILIDIKDVFKSSYPFSIGSVCNWIQLQGYRLVLVPLGFSEEVGIFSALASVGSAAIGAFSLIYSQKFTPKLYKTNGDYLKLYLIGGVVMIVIVCIFVGIFGDFVTRVLTKAVFEEYWYLMVYGVLIDGANLLIGAIAIHYTLNGKTKNIINSSLIGVLSLIIFYGIMFYAGSIGINSIGAPLLLSQWIVVLYMYTTHNRLNSIN